MYSEAPPQHELLDIIGAIYDATADSGKWAEVLARLARAFGGSSAQIVHASRGGHEVDFAALYGPEAGPLQRWEEATPRAVAARSDGPDAYLDWLWPAGREHALLFRVVDDEDQWVTGLGIMRGPPDEPFTQPQSAAFDAIVPHVRRAVAICTRTARLERERDALREAVDRLPLGVVLVNAPGEVLFANAAAKEMAGDGLVLSAGRIAVAEPADGSRLRTAMGALARGEVRAARVLPVNRPSGQRPLTLLLCPILVGSSSPAGSGGGPAIAVFISDPERECAGAIQVLRTLFALTPVEAEVLEMLVRGLDTLEIARQRGAQVSTVRHHLKSIFRKTATGRQSDLVKLVTTGPAWLRH